MGNDLDESMHNLINFISEDKLIARNCPKCGSYNTHISRETEKYYCNDCGFEKKTENGFRLKMDSDKDEKENTQNGKVNRDE